MSEVSETVKGELESYTTDLINTRHKICNFQQVLQNNSVLLSEASVIVIAIDSVLEKLSVPGLAENIKLDSIVTLTNDIERIKTSSTHLLAKRIKI